MSSVIFIPSSLLIFIIQDCLKTINRLKFCNNKRSQDSDSCLQYRLLRPAIGGGIDFQLDERFPGCTKKSKFGTMRSKGGVADG